MLKLVASWDTLAKRPFEAGWAEMLHNPCGRSQAARLDGIEVVKFLSKNSLLFCNNAIIISILASIIL
jgi:hypothetical protein